MIVSTRMKPTARGRYVFALATPALLASAVQFAFNPIGLGPEPERVLTDDFYANPLRSSADVELLVDGEEAFDAILGAINAATGSIYVQGRLAVQSRASTRRPIV